MVLMSSCLVDTIDYCTGIRLGCAVTFAKEDSEKATQKVIL